MIKGDKNPIKAEYTWNIFRDLSASSFITAAYLYP